MEATAVNPALQLAVLDKYARPFTDKSAKIIDDLDITIEKQDVVVEKQDEIGNKIKNVISDIENAGGGFSNAFGRSAEGLKELSMGFIDIKGIIEEVGKKFSAIQDLFAPLSEIGNFFGSGAFDNIKSGLTGEESKQDAQNREFKEATDSYKKASDDSNDQFQSSINSFEEALSKFKEVSDTILGAINTARGTQEPTNQNMALPFKDDNVVDADYEVIDERSSSNLISKPRSDTEKATKKQNAFSKSLDKTKNVFNNLGKMVGNVTKGFSRLLMSMFGAIGSLLAFSIPVVLFGVLVYKIIKALGGWDIISDTINFVDIQLEKLGIAFLEAKRVFRLGFLSKEDKEELDKRRDIVSFKQKRLDDTGEVREVEKQFTQDGKLDKEGFRQELIDRGLASNYSTINETGQIIDKKSGAIVDASTTEDRDLIRSLQPSVLDVLPGNNTRTMLKFGMLFARKRIERERQIESSITPPSQINAETPRPFYQLNPNANQFNSANVQNNTSIANVSTSMASTSETLNK